MNFKKCLFYGIIIAILIIILIRLCRSIKETFDELEEKEEIKEEDKGIIGKLVDKVKSGVNTIKEKVSPAKEEQPIDYQPDGKTEDLNILPKFVDKTTSSVMDAVKMIPQETDGNEWENIYMNDKNDNSFMISLGEDPKKNYGSMRFVDRSPGCCAATWPTPFKLKIDEEVMKNDDSYVPSPYTGSNNWTNAGCACVKKEDANALFTRGTNA